ncbi:hypothetical protein [Nocardioides sp. KR10-350]|uniref:hypothetical protein n=1 Tax=Nocardioides cheoyonin TaxID=3156615 RepID=UPI0032B467E7
MTQPPNPCPICGERAQLTFEDVIPTWLRKESLKAWQGDGPLPARVKVRICRGCNESLGRKFESPLAPILKRFVSGAPVVLDGATQVSIGAWIAKTSVLGLLMREQAGSEIGRTAAVELLRRLMCTGALCTGALCFPASVRLFHVSPTDDSDAALRRVVPGGVPPYPVGVYAVSTFGRFGYEFFSSTAELIARYAQVTRTHARSVTISPVPGDQVVWPPRHMTAQADLLALRSAYSDRRDPGLAPTSSRGG